MQNIEYDKEITLKQTMMLKTHEREHTNKK